MATFDEHYTQEALELFLARAPLERKDPGGEWVAATKAVTNLVYTSLNTASATNLANGLPMSDGSLVRFSLSPRA